MGFIIYDDCYGFFNKTLSITLLPVEVKNMKTIGDLVKKAGL